MLDSTTRLTSALYGTLGAQYVHTADLAQWSHDATDTFALPAIVVEPGSSEEVAVVVKLAGQFSVPIVTRGAGSGLAGGAVSEGGLILSLARLNRVIEIDAPAMTVTAEAGVVTGDLQVAVEALGLFYPPDPASLSWCSIGGNVAVNAGGPRALKYGMTRNYVLGMTVVLADGQTLRLGGKAHKQASGYSLMHLFIGAEGTLGIITEVTLRLLPLPPVRATLTALFSSLDAASNAVTAVLHSGILPCTIELMDHATLVAIENLLHLGLPQDAGAMMLVEQDGGDARAVRDELRWVQATCEAHGGQRVEIATDEQERARLWAARRNVYNSMVAAAPNLYVEDVVVPRSAIPQMVARIEQIAAETGVKIAVAGHAGDGNVHPCILFDANDPVQAAAAILAEGQIVRAALDLGGMISGEHGVGSLKRGYLEAGVGPAALDLMRTLKRTLDPHNLLNPGKVLPDVEISR
ncbi:MAG: glycolate oxidase subunit GlcD [Candidatus Chloroheliales bacterium]|nr:MAG: glycolate oxidase subunit GlcD [Chloroflexota bacterium]